MAQTKTTLGSVCCSLIIGCLIMGFGGAILNRTADSVGPNRYERVWLWCLITVVISGISMITVIGKFICGDSCGSATVKRATAVANLIAFLVAISVFSWGCKIYHNVSNSEYLRDVYDNYHELWTLFMTLFWFQVAVLILVGLILVGTTIVYGVLACVSCATGSKVPKFPIQVSTV